MNNISKKERWFGDTICDICGEDIHGLLYDAARSDCNEWATMCQKCFDSYGKGVGWGVGQRYEENEDGRFYLVAGGAPDEEQYEEDSVFDLIDDDDDNSEYDKPNSSSVIKERKSIVEDYRVVEDETYYSALEKHLCNSEFLMSEDNTDCFSERSIRELFCPACNAWKKLYGVPVDISEAGQLVMLKAGFYAAFYNELQYRSWRINELKKDIVFAKEVGWSYDRINRIYQGVHQLVSLCDSYSDMQKDAYFVIMSAALLEAFQQDGIDQPFYDFFMQSDLCKQVIKDRNLIFELIVTHSALEHIGLIKEQIPEIITSERKEEQEE